MSMKVGSYEAKTRLSELLREVQAVKRYTITLRGAPVAELVPTEGSRPADAIEAVEAMRQFMRAGPPVHGVVIKALIDEGRA